MKNHLNILGIRGIPAAYGGFETFAANLATYVREQGWGVTVYCQADESAPKVAIWTDEWNGIQRVHISTRLRGPLATIEFDLRCIVHVLTQPGIDLVLGYNTAIFTLIQRLMRRHVVMNMDGIEWKRQKWKGLARVWLWLNEWIGARFSSVVIADHPEILKHLEARGGKKAVFVPYGARDIRDRSPATLGDLPIEAGQYFVVIARVEPENSILEIITAFTQAKIDKKLVVLGRLDPENYPYHAKVLQAATSAVIFPGAIYEAQIVESLRRNCLAYIHGHQVGGTNPSLVEALGAGNAIIAHDNRFNRWVAGEGQLFFGSVDQCTAAMECVANNAKKAIQMGDLSHARHARDFKLEDVHQKYFDIFLSLAERSNYGAVNPRAPEADLRRAVR